MNNQRQLNFLEPVLNGIKIHDFCVARPTKKEVEKKTRKKDQKEQGEIIRRLKIQNKKLLQQVAALKLKAKQDHIETTIIASKASYMKKLNHSLSEALGSCSICWGEDPHCTNCSGDGISGWRNVSKRMFNVYVLPCLEKWSYNKQL